MAHNQSTTTHVVNSDPYANPLFLHAADNSGVYLVADKLTGESNYHTWRRSMVKSLNAKNKLGFIYGTLAKPHETHPDFGSWTRCNDMVCTWITNSVSKDIGSGTVYFDDAHLLWLNLEGRFRQSNLSKIYAVQDQLDHLYQGSLDLSSYYTRLTTLWEELKNFEELPSCTCGNCTCGSNARWIQLYEKRNIVRFLMRLNDSFSQTRRQISSNWTTSLQPYEWWEKAKVIGVGVAEKAKVIGVGVAEQAKVTGVGVAKQGGGIVKGVLGFFERRKYAEIVRLRFERQKEQDMKEKKIWLERMSKKQGTTQN